MTASLAFAGVVPCAVVTPPDTDALAATIRELAAAHKTFAFVGGATQLELGNPPAPIDTAIRTTACARVLEYAPEDQTITVEAGMTIAAIQRALDPHRQVLALDVADPHAATVGGAIATNAFGRRRMRYGAIKDNIVGIGVVRPDGTPARGGGKVVKNVAGFDLPKIMVGALGTLGAIVSATFRVHPADECRAAVRVRADAGAVYALAQATVDASLVPDSVVAYAGDADAYDLVVRFGGFARGVDEQVAALHALARERGLASESLDDAAVVAYDDRERALRGMPAVLRLGAAPVSLANVLAADPGFGGRSRVWYPLIGAAVAGAPHVEPAFVAALRAALSTVVVERAPLGDRTGLDAWGEPPPAFAIMARLKDRFDPERLCNPGRYVGGL
jgi:glycolate oxidase FAD binding subunit